MLVFFKKRFPLAIFTISFLLMLTGFFLAYIHLIDSDRPLIIHFDVFQGIDFFGVRNDVFTIILIAFTVILINLFLAIAIFERERFLSYILIIAGLFFSLLVLIAVAIIVSIN